MTCYCRWHLAQSTSHMVIYITTIALSKYHRPRKHFGAMSNNFMQCIDCNSYCCPTISTNDVFHGHWPSKIYYSSNTSMDEAKWPIL